jgi:hypothetical protein
VSKLSVAIDAVFQYFICELIRLKHWADHDNVTVALIGKMRPQRDVMALVQFVDLTEARSEIKYHPSRPVGFCSIVYKADPFSTKRRSWSCASFDPAKPNQANI